MTGPDEYSAVVDDNVYTNLMAEQNLRMAADVAARHYEQARGIGVDEEEIAAWRDAAADMHVPYDRRLGVHPQDANFTHHDVMDVEGLEFPLLLHVPYFQLYRKQVCKQPDLVMALFLRGDRFTLEEKARDFAYYEPLTVRDSSLSACVQAVVAAEVGHLELAYDYFGEAALMDLGDLEHNTRDGLHMASLAGSWIAAVAGFGGMRNHGDELRFHPRLPVALAQAALPRQLPRQLPAGHDHALARALRAARRLPAADDPPRGRADHGRRAGRARVDRAGPGSGAAAAAGPCSGPAAARRLDAGVEVDRADRRLVGQLGQQLVDDLVDLRLVVPEVVAHRAQRGVDDLQLGGREIEGERDLVGADEVRIACAHAPDRTSAPRLTSIGVCETKRRSV